MIITFIIFLQIIKQKKSNSIKVGILHSRTGPMTFTEANVIDATILAISEINRRGGVLSRQLEPILADGKSDPLIFAKEAEKLIKEKNVEVIFGCWTSSSRKTVKDVVEKYNILLFYPVQWEGIETSNNIIYTDSTTNQQAIPAIKWSIDNLGKKIFLVGPDTIYTKLTNETIAEFAPGIGAKVVGNEYINLSHENFDKMVQKIVETKPDVVINSLSDEGNIKFFKEIDLLTKKGLDINVMSFSISETELQEMEIENVKGTYSCWSYFQSLDSKENREFVFKVKDKFGKSKVTSDTMQAAYCGVYLWANAVKKIYSTKTDLVKKTLPEIVFNAPDGILQIDGENNNAYRPIYVGKVNSQRQFDIIWKGNIPIKPVIYPNDFFVSKFRKKIKTKKDWQNFVNELYRGWGNQWVG